MQYLKNQKGSTLVITIILLMIVSILGTAMMFSVVSEVRFNRAIEEKAIANYLAQAGIDHALYLIEDKYDTLSLPYQQEVVLGDRSRVYNFTISKSGEIYTVTSTGKIENSGVVKQSDNLQATISEDGEVIVK